MATPKEVTALRRLIRKHGRELENLKEKIRGVDAPARGREAAEQGQGEIGNRSARQGRGAPFSGP